MNKQDNLISFNQMSKEKQRQIASNGGKKSVEAKKRMKSQKELIMMMLSTPSNESNKQVLARMSIPNEDATINAEIGYKLIKEAKKGKEWAFEKLYKIMGMYETQQQIEKQKQEIELLKLECEKLRQQTNIGVDTYEDLTPLVEKLGLKDGE